MLLKELANSGICLPEIGFGTWNYSGGVVPLRAAIGREARLIDTAESYGPKRSSARRSRADDIKCFSQLRCFLGISGGAI